VIEALLENLHRHFGIQFLPFIDDNATYVGGRLSVMSLRVSVLLPVVGCLVFGVALASTSVLSIAGSLPLHPGPISRWLAVICFGLACYTTYEEGASI
jgi:hypothetical protein